MNNDYHTAHLHSAVTTALRGAEVSPQPDVDHMLAKAAHRRRRQRIWLTISGGGLLALLALLTRPLRAPDSGSSVSDSRVSFLDASLTVVGDIWLRLLLVVAVFAVAAWAIGEVRKRRRARPISGWVRTLLLTLGCLVSLVVGIRLSVQIYYVPSPSMEPAIEVGSRLVVAKYDTDVEVGDVVIHELVEPDAGDLVKRVVALEGDTVAGVGGQLLVNGVPSMALQTDPKQSPLRDFGPITVPANELFVMGDNYNQSRDSRDYGTISVDSLRGTVRLSTSG